MFFLPPNEIKIRYTSPIFCLSYCDNLVPIALDPLFFEFTKLFRYSVKLRFSW